MGSARTLHATLIGTFLVSLMPVSSSAQNASSDHLPAIWRTHQVEFDFKSERLAFRCEEFAWRLGRILHSVGARLDSRTQLVCSGAFSSAIKGHIVVTAPVEATAANVQRALAEITSVDQLAARLNRQPDPKSRIRVFPAEWRQVSSGEQKLDVGDCDLLRAVVRQVLPALELRELASSTTCMSNRVPRFSATALVRVDGVSIDEQAKQSPAVAAGPNCAHDQSDAACDAPAEESDLEAMPAG